MLERLTLPFLIILNLLLKYIYISDNSIGGDEPFSIYHAQLNISSIIHYLAKGNNPPLYEILLHYWIKIFGINELSVRVPSLLFSSATVYFIYKTGRDFYNYRVALLAGILFTFSNFHIAFSHEARVYSLFALLSAGSMFVYLNIINRPKPNKYFIFLVLINTLLLYAHYFGFFIIAIQTIPVLLIKEVREKLLRNYIFYTLALITLYLPNIYTLIVRFIDSSTHGTWLEAPGGLISIYHMLWRFSNKPFATIIGIAILITALVKLVIKKDYSAASVNTKVIVLWFLFPFLFMFGVSYFVPMFHDRYLVFVSLAYYLTLAISATYIIPEGRYSYYIPFILGLAFVVTVKPDVDNKRHVRATVAKVTELKTKGTKVLICPADFVFNFTYYYSPEIFRDVDNFKPYDRILDNLKKEEIYMVNDLDTANLNGANRLLYLDAGCSVSVLENKNMERLTKDFKVNSTHKFYEIFTVYEFIKNK